MDKQQRLFEYQASNVQGVTISGQINASSEREAVRLLNQQELTPSFISAIIETPARGVFFPSKKVTTKEKIITIRELATLLKAGVSLTEAIDSMAEAHAQVPSGPALAHIHRILASGGTLSKAMRTAQPGYPEYLYQLVEAGELTGKLAQALGDAATQMEYEQRLAQEMRNALIYPAVLVISGIVATLLVFIVVVPRFASMLKSNHADIPALSVWVISTGLFVKQNLLWVALISAGLAMLAAVTLSNPHARAKLYETLSRMPLIGAWLLETETGRWAATFSTMLENRVPIIHAMELSQNGVRLMRVRAQLQQAVRDVRSGKKLADALAASRVIDSIGINLIRVGERSGELGTMLRALATLHENAGRDRMTRFLVLLEPAAILIIGIVIGTIMIAVMLAVTSLSNIPL